MEGEGKPSPGPGAGDGAGMGGRVPGGLWIIAGKENLGLIQRQTDCSSD